MKYDKNKYFKIIDDGKLKTSEIIDQMRKQFPIYFYDEENADKNFPAPKNKTIRYFKKVVEADEENANKSADDLRDVAGITLRERLIMEMQYFSETGKHLDIENWTLCSGSRYADGSVPCADWDPTHGRFEVDWTNHGDRDAHLRFRVAVSLSPSSSNPSEMSIETAIEMVKKEGYKVIKII